MHVRGASYVPSLPGTPEELFNDDDKEESENEAEVKEVISKKNTSSKEELDDEKNDVAKKKEEEHHLSPPQPPLRRLRRRQLGQSQVLRIILNHERDRLYDSRLAFKKLNSLLGPLRDLEQKETLCYIPDDELVQLALSAHGQLHFPELISLESVDDNCFGDLFLSRRKRKIVLGLPTSQRIGALASSQGWYVAYWHLPSNSFCTIC
jgi:hypothetical protein